MSEGWNRPFIDGPATLPDGRELKTLRQAADYITALPKKEAALPVWQAAIEALLLCSRGGDTMIARIGVLKALNRDKPVKVPAPRRPKAAKKYRIVR